MKKSPSDIDLIRRGPLPERHGMLGVLLIAVTLAMPFVIGGGFMLGALVGGALALGAGSNALAGLALGTLWGGMLSSAGIFGVAAGIGCADDLYTKKAQAANAARDEAIERQQKAGQAASVAAASSAVIPLGAGVRKNFAAAQSVPARKPVAEKLSTPKPPRAA